MLDKNYLCMQHQNASYDITDASARIHNVIDRYSIFAFPTEQTYRTWNIHTSD